MVRLALLLLALLSLAAPAPAQGDEPRVLGTTRFRAAIGVDDLRWTRDGARIEAIDGGVGFEEWDAGTGRVLQVRTPPRETG